MRKQRVQIFLSKKHIDELERIAISHRKVRRPSERVRVALIAGQLLGKVLNTRIKKRIELKEKIK